MIALRKSTPWIKCSNCKSDRTSEGIEKT
uniref:Uncharacterized protein n=1 Tax=Arundo donax TaxID=35708 RepID=A0A0A9F6Y2_ARUDO